MAFGVHKDRTPTATIRGIQQILAKLGIAVSEETYRFAKNCFSVKLQDSSFPVATNGKGVTKDLARASAHAEFMERLQNGILYGTEYGLMREDRDLFPDARWLPAEQVAGTFPGNGDPIRRVLPEHGSRQTRSASKRQLCVPYWRVSDGAVVYLPRQWMRFAVSSNGMCAGNTTEEALVQGLCEIFERHALRQVFTGKANAPTIPLASLRGLSSCKLVRQIEEQGGRIIVKDCTLGGTFPVVGVAMLDADRRKYKIALGSDPVLDVAIHRCLTELVQGFERHNIDGQMSDLDQVLLATSSAERDRNIALQLEKAMVDGTGAWNERFFHSNGRPQHQRAFSRSYQGHSEMLGHLLCLAQSVASDVYIRDVSYLGFPTFQIYAPGLSEPYNEDLRQYSDRRARLTDLLLRLPARSVASIKRDIAWVDALAKKLIWATYERIAGVQFRDTASLHDTDLAHMLAFLRLRIGDYGGAFRSLHGYLRSQEIESFGGYQMCALFVLKGKADGMSNQAVVRSLSGLFGGKLVNEVVDDLAKPSRSFRYLRLPICGNCRSCPARIDCLYPRWKKVFSTLRKHFAQNPIDQSHLAQRLAGYVLSGSAKDE